jgi:alpha-ketoglutarate-dependent taurine dioxygenase
MTSPGEDTKIFTTRAAWFSPVLSLMRDPRNIFECGRRAGKRYTWPNRAPETFMARAFDIAPLDATFGAVITGAKVAELDEAGFRELYDAWLEYALLVFPGQFLARDQQIAFAKRFGPLEFEMAALSNVRKDGSLRREADNDDMMKVLKGNMGWHCDSTYMPVQAKGAVFSAEVVPTVGGHTGFADMRAAYDALDAATRARIERLAAHHSLHYSQAKAGQQRSGDGEYSGYGFHDGPVPLRPLVKIHPETGRKSLLVGRHAHAIPGLSEPEAEKLLRELAEFACQPPRVYHHDWRAGDAVVWDNRCLMHRATPWDMNQPRIMWHSRIAGDPRSEAALAQAA